MKNRKNKNYLKYQKKKYQLYNLFHLTAKNLKTMVRDRLQLVWIVGYPLLFMFIFSLAFTESDEDEYIIYIDNEDNDGCPSLSNPLCNASEILINVLEDDLEDTIDITEDYDSTKEAEQALLYEEIDAIITIDIHFTEALFNISGYQNIRPEIKIDTIPDEVIENTIRSIMTDIVDEILLKSNGIITPDIDSEQEEDAIELTGFDYLAPAFIVGGVLLCISQLSAHFAEEKEKKTLQRLTTTPVARRDIVLSGLFSQLIVAAMQIILMLLLAYFVFGAYFNPNANLILLFLIPLLFAFTALGFGLLLASFVKSQGTASGLAWLIILPLQFLGGMYFSFNNPIKDYIPTSYAVHAMRVIMLNGQNSWAAIGTDILVMLGVGIVLTIIGIILFQRKSSSI